MNKFEEEKEYLNLTLDCIYNQLEELKQTKKNLMAEGISLSYEDTKRGEHLNIGTKLGFYDDIMKKLERIIPSPYFGRFDFCEENNNEVLKIYIGKSNVTKDGKFVITDWRAPICSLYYDSEIGNVSYEAIKGFVNGNISLKRQINIEDSELIDVIDSNLVTNDDLLNKYLNVNADNKMKTIIQSIQKEQNQIIRKPIKNNIIVQGVAGSGKTSVALHRIAYLIYKLSNEINLNQFLVLGPNNYFLNYISSILPELETEPVDQKTLLDLTNEYLNEKLSYSISNNKVDEDKLQKVQAYKSSLQYKEAIDKFINLYMMNSVAREGFILDDKVIYTPEEIKELLFSLSPDYPNYNMACQYFVKKFKEDIDSIYNKLNYKYRKIYTTLPKDDPERKKAVEQSMQLEKFVKQNGVKLLKKYFKDIQISAFNLYKVFVSNISDFCLDLSESEVEILQKETLLNLKKKKISFDDIAALIHINHCLTGDKIKYKNIVIDEAQDYGLFHFDAIKEITKDGVFSIYGDLAQSIYSYRGIDSWESVKDTIFNNNCEILNLSKSYRTTIEITNNANKVLNKMNLDIATPVIRHGKEVQFFEDYKDSDFKYNKINEWINFGHKTIAIICKTEKEAKQEYSNLINKGINAKYIKADEEKYDGGVFVLTSANSKGLEFDCVIINDASDNVYSDKSDIDMHLLYVACTRSLHEQIILYKKELTKIFDDTITKSNNKEKIKKI